MDTLDGTLKKLEQPGGPSMASAQSCPSARCKDTSTSLRPMEIGAEDSLLTSSGRVLRSTGEGPRKCSSRIASTPQVGHMWLQ